jgi:dihydrofolate reductase
VHVVKRILLDASDPLQCQNFTLTESCFDPFLRSINQDQKIKIMRKIIVEAEVSLDGIVNSPEIWPEIFKYHSDDVADYLNTLLFSPDALLLGRLTYEVFAEVWPARTGQQADWINQMPKYVASRTLKEPLRWNSTLINGDVVEELRKIKRTGGKDLVQLRINSFSLVMARRNLRKHHIQSTS